MLILDDDKNQLNYLNKLLSSHFECDLFSDPIEAEKSFKERDYQGVITDLHMPIVNGVEFIRKINAYRTPGLPVIVFSGDNSTNAKLECLELGINDYLNFGLNEQEIILRIKNNFSKKGKLTFEKITIDETVMQVFFNDELIDVTQIEYKILTYLLRHRGQVPKKKLTKFIWPSSFAIDKNLNSHMTNLRNKIKVHQYTLLTTKEDIVVLSTIMAKESIHS